MATSGVSDSTNAYSSAKKLRQEVEDAEKRVKDVNAENEKKIEQLKENFQTEATRTEIRGQEQVEHEKAKGYEQLANTRRLNQKALEAQARAIAQEDFKQTENTRTVMSDSAKRAENQLRELQSRSHMEIEQENAKAKNNIDLLRKDHERQYEALKFEKDGTLEELKKTQETTLADMKARTLQATQDAEQHYTTGVEEKKKLYGSSLANLDQTTAENLRSRQQSFAQKIASYSSRAQDPFYKMMGPGGALKEEAGAYVVTVQAPKHEQDALQLTARGDELVLSGSRKNFERMEKPGGSFQETSAFQNFRESFPIVSPIESKKILKSVEGDTVTFRVPKKTRPNLPGIAGQTAEQAGVTPEKKAPVEAPRVDRPHFPEGIAATPVSSPASKNKTLS